MRVMVSSPLLLPYVYLFVYALNVTQRQLQDLAYMPSTYCVDKERARHHPLVH